MRLRPIGPDDQFHLCDEEATIEGAPSGDKLGTKLHKRLDALERLQAKLYADGRYALLVILQGRDASGKDGTIRRVFGALNPQGCVVTSFREPTPLERRHDFLWRIHCATPPRGMIGIFNRSHYEDVIVPRIEGTVAKPIVNSRYEQINDFERMLVQNNVIVLKFFLHISRAEQRQRLLARVQERKKNWKVHDGDFAARAMWDEYTEAYRDMIQRCSGAEAPWYVVPADDKEVRDYLVAGTVARTLKRLKLRYPTADPAALRAAEQALCL